MEIEQRFGQALDMLAETWSDSAKLAVLAGMILVCLVVSALMMLAASGKKRPRKTAASSPAPSWPAAGKPQVKTMAGAAPDLDPEEWVSGNVIHYDRQRSFGYIRCDRVKGHVRFHAADFKPAPRVGETVRFKGRHGARRKPVAILVEPMPKSSLAG